MIGSLGGLGYYIYTARSYANLTNVMAGVIASLLYFPMLIFSGATLPYEVMPTAMQRMADVLPLTQGVKLLKSASLGEAVGSVHIPILIMLGLALICTTISLKYFRWES